MLSIRNILSISLLLSLVTSLVHPHGVHQQPQDQEADAGFAGLQKLLEEVDAPSLHAALHDLSPKKFKHGMFQDDRTAVQAIHKDEPSLATSVVAVAKRNVMEDIKKDMAKRAQDISNGTTTTTSPAAAADSTTSAHVVTPVPQGGDTSSTTPSADTSTTPAAASPDTTSTSTSSSGGVVAASGTGSSPSSAASVGGSLAATSASLTNGQVVTSTNSVGLTIVSTVGGGVHTISPSAGGSTSSGSKTQSSTTSTVVHTSTLPNGSQSVVTAVTVVNAGGVAADTPTGTAGVATTGTSSGSPGLQTGEAPMTRGWCKEMVLIVGGAVGVAMMM